MCCCMSFFPKGEGGGERGGVTAAQPFKAEDETVLPHQLQPKKKNPGG